MSNCRDTQKFKTSEASTKSAMRTQGAIDKFLNITDLNLFRQLNGRWSRDAQDRYDVDGMLFSEELLYLIKNHLKRLTQLKEFSIN